MSTVIPNTVIPSDIAEHLNYQDGMFLTSAYMSLEHDYFSNWLQLQNQYLYTPGVLAGMEVSLQPGATLAVSQGVAFDPLGHFLILPGDATPLTVPSNASNPMYVYALYPDNSQATSDVIDESAGVYIDATVPANGVPLALIEIGTKNPMVKVTDVRTPVRSRLPAMLTALNQSLQGTVSVQPGSDACTSVTVDYLPSQARAFDRPPLVTVSVQGAVPYATAVHAETDKFVVTLLALMPAQPGAAELALHWVALANTSN
ncbi:hypothetical protein ACO0LM_01450 [Undibacterium sp. Di26W]|uniref:hypothetical protein n=1 Tax=Undibacterium sp. Di26W TaxID=3413035 RepID=UPI003BF27746